MQELQDMSESTPIRALSNVGVRYTFNSAACKLQNWCVLLQEQPDGTIKPVGYWSQYLTVAEQAYEKKQRECLAIDWSVLMLRPGLDGTRLTIRIDHNSLKGILNLAGSICRLARWRLRQHKFELDVVRRACIKY